MGGGVSIPNWDRTLQSDPPPQNGSYGGGLSTLNWDPTLQGDPPSNRKMGPMGGMGCKPPTQIKGVLGGGGSAP